MFDKKIMKENKRIYLYFIGIIILFIFLFLLVYKMKDSEEKYYKEKGFENSIEIVDSTGKIKRIYTKNNKELVDTIKKEIVEKEVAK